MPVLVTVMFTTAVFPDGAFAQPRGTKVPTQVNPPANKVPTQVNSPEGSASKNEIENPLGEGNDDLFAFIETIIDVVLRLGAVVAVLAIIYAGFLFVTARGDEKQLETAKKVLLYTVIGMAILLGARALSTIIINTVTSVGDAAL